MQIHELTRTHSLRKKRQVGRGGKRGKTAGRGTKGQKARAGRKLRPELRDIIKKIPKQRGYKFNVIGAKATAINVKLLESTFDAGTTVTPALLLERGLIRQVRGKMPVVKLLGTGDLSKKLSISGMEVSASARAKVEAAGGAVA